jgi:hypothetical protein
MSSRAFSYPLSGWPDCSRTVELKAHVGGSTRDSPHLGRKLLYRTYWNRLLALLGQFRECEASKLGFGSVPVLLEGLHGLLCNFYQPAFARVRLEVSDPHVHAAGLDSPLLRDGGHVKREPLCTESVQVKGDEVVFLGPVVLAHYTAPVGVQ